MWLTQSGKTGESVIERGKICFAFTCNRMRNWRETLSQNSEMTQSQLLCVAQMKTSNKILDWSFIRIFFDFIG